MRLADKQLRRQTTTDLEDAQTGEQTGSCNRRQKVYSKRTKTAGKMANSRQFDMYRVYTRNSNFVNR